MSNASASLPRSPARSTPLARRLERLYAREAQRANVAPDPLAFVYEYDDVADREIAALVASSLAYGRVAQIGRSVRDALARLGPAPAARLCESTRGDLVRASRGFRHRFTSEGDLAGLLTGAASTLRRHGSLAACFRAGYDPDHETILPAATAFVAALAPGARTTGFPLLASPDAGSGCKRLNLFLRWMIRRDDVDPGLFDLDAAHQLVVPIDTHMHHIGHALGFTRRAQADLTAALEITAGFRAMAPRDPVRYDFVLARRGMRGTLENVLSGRCRS